MSNYNVFYKVIDRIKIKKDSLTTQLTQLNNVTIENQRNHLKKA